MALTTHTHKYVAVNTCLAAIEVMTEAQRHAIERLVMKPTVRQILVWLDMFAPEKGNLRFNLYGDRGPQDVFLVGLIEPDGSTHT